MKTHISPATEASYAAALTYFADACAVLGLRCDPPEPETIVQVLQYAISHSASRQKPGMPLSPTYMSNMVAALRRNARAERRRLREFGPDHARQVPSLDDERIQEAIRTYQDRYDAMTETAPLELTRQSVSAMIHAGLDRHSHAAPGSRERDAALRDVAAVAMMHSALLRAADMAPMTASDVDLDRSRVRIDRSAPRHLRPMVNLWYPHPVQGESVSSHGVIRRWVMRSRALQTGPLWPSQPQRPSSRSIGRSGYVHLLRRLAHCAGLPRADEATPTALRNGRIQELLQSGAGLDVMVELTGVVDSSVLHRHLERMRQVRR